jgi:hypothetical protein
VDDAERAHLLTSIAALERARRRWKVLALTATPALAVLSLLALANVIATSLTLRDAVERERRAREAAEEALYDARVSADQAQMHQAEARQALEEASRAMQNNDPQDRPLSLALEVIERDVRAGTTPSFRLTVTNASKAPQKVLDIRKRRDLQHTYYDLEVSQDGKPVRLPRAISDPGPITDADYLTLAPGDSVTFVLERFPAPLKDLPPGTYQASVRFWQDPLRSDRTAYNSSGVTFSVQE